MTSPSNIYAEKVFAEHPVALWALDEPADYISLIQGSSRDLSTWTISGGTKQSIVDPTAPFVDSYVTRILGAEPTGTSASVVLTSGVITNFNTLDAYLQTFGISAYLYSETSLITKIEIGYQIGTQTPVLKAFNPKQYLSWGLVAKTFDIPSGSNTFKIVVKITYSKSDAANAEYAFLINGLAVGQWLENYSSQSLGQEYLPLPTSIATTEQYGIVANSYGLQNKPGYYIVKNKTLKAKASSIPMVYGSSSLASLSPNSDQPSMIVPGFGFLNEVGRYKELTLEAWLKVNAGSTVHKRIIGPLASQDGLYVNGPFLTLKIGSSIESYSVGEWGRPMLIDIKVSKSTAALLINGDQVISLTLDQNTLELPEAFSSTGKDQDWIGFYSHEEIAPVSIDCVAIYPYLVSDVVAKRRFVYGQAVSVPENINSSYNNKSVIIDYSLANYANNYNYPDIGKWKNGITENVIVENDSLAMPRFELPAVVFSNKTIDQWYTALEAAQDDVNNYMTMRPDPSWNSTNGYLLIDKFNMTNQNTKAFYGIFEKTDTSTESQTLFKFYNTINNNYFEISLLGSTIKYEFSYNGVKTEMQNNLITGLFAVGFDIHTFSKYFGNNLSEFFGNRDQLGLYVAGNRDFSKTFTGKIYKVGFCTEKNFSKVSSVFNPETGIVSPSGDTSQLYTEDQIWESYSPTINFDGAPYVGEDPGFWDQTFDGGTPTTSFGTNLSEHTASYTLILKNTLSRLRLDIAVDGFWQDYVPLSYFSKYISNANNEKYYSLDFIQFNISYPESSKFDGISEVFRGNGVTVLPVGKHYDTTKEVARSYITFQSLTSKAVQDDSFFVKTEAPNQNGVVIPGADWATTKYEVINGTIIYPPSGVELSKIGIAVHLQFKVDGIFTNPIRVKSIQLAAQALNDVGENPVGTKYGVPIFPYTKLGIYFDYKSRNPYTIYKGTSPYLYLTKSSGVRLRGDAKIGLNRGITMKINTGKSESYTVSSIQASIRYDEELFPSSPIEVFEVESNNAFFKFYLEAASVEGKQKRGKIYAVNTKTGKIDSSVRFYLNGILVKDALISINEWHMLGLEFTNKLIFGTNGTLAPTAGAFRVTGPVTINNISNYQLSAAQEGQSAKLRKWINVKNTAVGNDIWQDVVDDYDSWEDVLYVITESSSSVDPADVYKIYTGTKKIIAYNEKPIRFHSYQYKIYKDISWQSTTLIAV